MRNMLEPSEQTRRIRWRLCPCVKLDCVLAQMRTNAIEGASGSAQVRAKELREAFSFEASQIGDQLEQRAVVESLQSFGLETTVDQDRDKPLFRL